jgi:hypothetical protein
MLFGFCIRGGGIREKNHGLFVFAFNGEASAGGGYKNGGDDSKSIASHPCCGIHMSRTPFAASMRAMVRMASSL